MDTCLRTYDKRQYGRFNDRTEIEIIKKSRLNAHAAGGCGRVTYYI